MHDSAPASSPSLRDRHAAWTCLGLGLVQGVAGWALHRAIDRHVWPQTSPAWLGASIYLAASGPLVAYLSEGGFASRRARVAFVVALSLLMAALGAHAGHTATLRPDFSQPFAACAFAFIVIPLAGGFDPARRRFDYDRLFELAWRNAILLPVAAALTGIFWLLLWAGAWLMASIGIVAPREWLSEPGFAYPATCGAFGLAIGLAITRGETLVVFRRFWLSLTRWFLPLAIAFALCWLAALPFTGLHRLLGTHSTALYLFWFCTLSITFANAAFEDGHREAPFAGWLARATAWGWLVMPVLALLGDWALGMRVADRGWTSDRVWAALVGLLVTVHAVGYAPSFRGCWMRLLPATNILAAAIEVVAIVALVSPIADARRIAVESQLARLKSGAVTAEAFDWNLLRWHSGHYGTDALKALAAAKGDGVLAARAASALGETSERFERAPAQDPEAALAALRQKIEVLPAGMQPDSSLLQWLSRRDADYDERECLAAPERCKLWIADFDHDGQADALLMWGRAGRVQAALYTRMTDGWRRQGNLYGGTRSLTDWTVAIAQGRTNLVAPRWPDFVIDGETIRLNR